MKNIIKNFAVNSRSLAAMILFSLMALSSLTAKAQDGSLDSSFSPWIDASVGEINVVARQPDGKIIIGGSFSRVVGSVVLRNLARLNADGSIDVSFSAPVSPANSFVSKIAVQTDGRIIVGGNFSGVSGGGRVNIARLNADGSLDASLNLGNFVFSPLQGLALQPDGKILIGGGFLNNGVSSTLARLNADGSFDASFAPGELGSAGGVRAIAVQPDGKIVIGGEFTTIGGTTQNRIARLNANGSLDATFNSGSGASAANRAVTTITLQPDGKIIIGGEFVIIDNSPRNGIARLNANGSLDASFVPGSGIGGVFIDLRTMELQADGKILVGGRFPSYNGVTRRGFARLNQNGSLDASFDPQTSDFGVINSLLVQPDGKIVIGGFFSINGSPIYKAARLLSSSTVVPNLTINNVTLNEGNSGATTFDFTVNLSAAATQTVTVNYATTNGTATAPTDYQTANGALSFAPGETAKTVTVFVNGDADIEPSENFTVNLSGAVNATITGGVGTGTIINDDACAYSISPTSLNIGAGGGAGNTIIVTTQAGCAYTAASNNSFITINSGGSGAGSGTVTFTVAANAGAARTGTITVAGRTFTVNQAAAVTFRRTLFDFDGDGKADISVYRPSSGYWYSINSTAGFSQTQWGAPTDKPVPADYDGDGKTDVAVYRPSTGYWYFINSTTGFSQTQWGAPTDLPVPADYDGDGKADIAVYRPSTGYWYLIKSVAGFSQTQWGAPTDKPVPADYDGDGKADIAVYRPSSGYWYSINSTTGFSQTQWGAPTDIPVPADYDGDGKTDVAVYRPSTGYWYLINSAVGFSQTQWGAPTDKPIPADYDGDGKADISVYRPSSGYWYSINSTTGFSQTQWGAPTDIPLPNAFVR